MNADSMVSVIVPVFNVEKYIEECIESICRQTYDKIEILLIDDGSKDRSGKLCDLLAERDNRIRVFHKKNEGLGLTRNYGIDYIAGEYVVFVDSDDYIERDSIKRMINEAIRQNADLVVEEYKKVSEAGKILFDEKYEYEIFEGKDVKDKFLPRMIGSCPDKTDSIFTTVCSKLYKAEIIKKSGVRFHSERKLQSEDLAYQLELIPYLNKVVVIPQSGYFYRDNSQSLTTTYKQNRFEESKKVYDYTVKQIEKLNIPDEAKFRADKMLFVQVKAAIKQENPAANKKSWIKCRENVKAIISDELLQERIREYPIKKMKFKQKVYLYLIKMRLIDLLMMGVQIEK